jgi:arginase family enzyme
MSLMLRPVNPYQRLNVFEECAVIDYGDTEVAPGYLPESFERIEAALTPLATRDVQTPEAGGPTAREIVRLVRGLRGLDLVGADVVEMNPNYDAGQITALLAATVAAEVLALVAAHRRDARAALTG